MLTERRWSTSWQRAILVALKLLLLLGMSSCCPKGSQTVILGQSQIVKNSDGTYTVTAAWMNRRHQFEAALRQTLKRCMERP